MFNLLKTNIFSFRQLLTFWVTNLENHLVEDVHMDHTDHLGFRSIFILICKFKSKVEFGKMPLFEMIVKMT